MSKKPRRRGGAYPQKVRCKATNRWGEQCRKWAMKGGVVCNKHGGAAPQVRRKAQERIMMAQDDAASLLVRFMNDKSVPYAERRRCAEFLLNFDSRNEVTVTLKRWERNIEGLLVDVGDSDDDIIDAEVIEDSPELTSSEGDWASPRALPPLDRDPPTYRRGPRTRGE